MEQLTIETEIERSVNDNYANALTTYIERTNAKCKGTYLMYNPIQKRYWVTIGASKEFLKNRLKTMVIVK